MLFTYCQYLEIHLPDLVTFLHVNRDKQLPWSCLIKLLRLRYRTIKVRLAPEGIHSKEL